MAKVIITGANRGVGLTLAAGSSGRLTIGPFRVTRAFVP